MSYTPTVWKSGDVVTSTKLNKIEQGIANAGGGGGAFFVPITYQSGATTAGKTAGEIVTAIANGSNILFTEEEESGTNYYPLTYSFVGDGDYAFAFIADTETHLTVFLSAPSADDYPTNAE